MGQRKTKLAKMKLLNSVSMGTENQMWNCCEPNLSMNNNISLSDFLNFKLERHDGTGRPKIRWKDRFH